MIFAIIAYFLVFAIVNRFHKKGSLSYQDFPALKLTRDGIIFNSQSWHRIKIDCSSAMQIGNSLYLKTPTQLVIITNIKECKIYNSYIYFSCQGETKILFNTEEYFRYFAINVFSNMFDITELKRQAILDLIENDFIFQNCEKTKKYIKILKDILNITINNNALKIEPNKYKLSYQVEYKLNNKIKRVIMK